MHQLIQQPSTLVWIFGNICLTTNIILTNFVDKFDFISFELADYLKKPFHNTLVWYAGVDI